LVLTTKQCDLLINIFNASLTRAAQSGIPIGKEYYEDLDTIKEKLYKEQYEAMLREGGSKS
jgi:hypothetical protein